MKNITTKTRKEKILNSFREGDVNLKTKKGYIFKVGDILSKLEGDRQFFAIDGKWVEV